MMNIGCSPSIYCWETCQRRGGVNLVRRELIFHKFRKRIKGFYRAEPMQNIFDKNQ